VSEVHFNLMVAAIVVAFVLAATLGFRHALRVDRERRRRIAERLFGAGGYREEKGAIVGRLGQVELRLWDKARSPADKGLRHGRAFSVVATPCPPGHDFAVFRREGSVSLRPLKWIGRLNEVKLGRPEIDDVFYLHGTDAQREQLFSREAVQRSLDTLRTLPGFVALQAGSVNLDHDFTPSSPPSIRIKMWGDLESLSADTLETLVDVLGAFRTQLA